MSPLAKAGRYALALFLALVCLCLYMAMSFIAYYAMEFAGLDTDIHEGLYSFISAVLVIICFLIYNRFSSKDKTKRFIKTRKMSAVSKDSLLDNLDEFNSHISKSWLDIVKAKGIEAGDKVAYIEDGKLMLVTSERISDVPSDSTILFNIDEDGRYYNVYYCQNEKLKNLYTNADEVLG